MRLLKAFLRWAASEPDLKGKADPTAASAKKTREFAGKAKPKNDYIQREQLPAWFDHVRQLPNPVISAYLQCLLLTGARREELAALKWEDVNFQWKGIDLKDKIEGRRAVPLTPYVAHLLQSLPKRNEWVFSSVLMLDATEHNTERRARYHAAKGQAAPVGDISSRSASGRLTDPSIAHRKACTAAGLVLTLHGLGSDRSASPCAGAGEVHRWCFASVSQCAGAQRWCRLAGASWLAPKFQRLWCTLVPENDITPHCPQCSPVTALKLRSVSPTACAPFG